MSEARLVLADGTVFRGRSVGAEGTATGEAVFNTGMTGYQEVLTDPSYRGQIVTMTYPEIGNYGIADEDAGPSRTICATRGSSRSTTSTPALSPGACARRVRCRRW